MSIIRYSPAFWTPRLINLSNSLLLMLKTTNFQKVRDRNSRNFIITVQQSAIFHLSNVFLLYGQNAEFGQFGQFYFVFCWILKFMFYKKETPVFERLYRLDSWLETALISHLNKKFETNQNEMNVDSVLSAITADQLRNGLVYYREAIRNIIMLVRIGKWYDFHFWN